MRSDAFYIILEDGESCPHPGCTNHISHPCETCGRFGAEGVAVFKRVIPGGTSLTPFTDALRAAMDREKKEG
jgi:hypothetical protein